MEIQESLHREQVWVKFDEEGSVDTVFPAWEDLNHAVGEEEAAEYELYYLVKVE